MKNKYILSIGFIIGLIPPLIGYGQVQISEIMYDPAGSDTKREWIEVFNAGAADVDLSTYFFFEANVYHKLVAQGDPILKSGAYAIIVDSVPEVRADYPQFTGLMFDSVFSLNNTGEPLAIANAQKEITHSFTYDVSMGGNNTGHSIQITGSSSVHAIPTFGEHNKTSSEIIETASTSSAASSSSGSSGSSSTLSSHDDQVAISEYTPPAEFKIGIGRDRLVSVHTPISFEVYNSRSDINPRYRWNFADLETGGGRSVSHVYAYPGTYQVVVEATAQNYTATTRTEITVIEPLIEVLQGTSTLMLRNAGSGELNLGSFVLQFVSGSLRIPDNTIIKAGDSMTVPRSAGQILRRIFYPDGELYRHFELDSGLVDHLRTSCTLGEDAVPVCKERTIREFLVQ